MFLAAASAVAQVAADPAPAVPAAAPAPVPAAPKAWTSMSPQQQQ